jgi:aspartate kinase
LIYTDVDGVYTTDPRVCLKPQGCLQTVSFEEMLEMASMGSKSTSNSLCRVRW